MHHEQKSIGRWFKSAHTELGQGEETFSIGLNKLGLFNLNVNELKGGGQIEQAINHIDSGNCLLSFTPRNTGKTSRNYLINRICYENTEMEF